MIEAEKFVSLNLHYSSKVPKNRLSWWNFKIELTAQCRPTDDTKITFLHYFVRSFKNIHLISSSIPRKFKTFYNVSIIYSPYQHSKPWDGTFTYAIIIIATTNSKKYNQYKENTIT